MIVPVSSWEYKYLIDSVIPVTVTDDDIKSVTTNCYYIDKNNVIFYIVNREYKLLVWMGII